jgi:hypothetical protein
MATCHPDKPMEPATPCPNCGQPITLFWDTHIVEEDEHG